MNEWDRLIRQVELELAEMYDELAAVGPLLRVLNQREPDLVELRAVAATLHAFYNGVERIFTIIHKNLDRDGLAGHRWHRELLERMALARDNRRAVIDQELTDTLLNYLGFREHYTGIKWPASLLSLKQRIMRFANQSTSFSPT